MNPQQLATELDVSMRCAIAATYAVMDMRGIHLPVIDAKTLRLIMLTAIELRDAQDTHGEQQ